MIAYSLFKYLLKSGPLGDHFGEAQLHTYADILTCTIFRRINAPGAEAENEP